MEKIKEKIFGTKEFGELSQQAGALRTGRSLTISGIAGSLLAYVAVCVFQERRSQVLLLTSDEDKAEKLRDDCALLAGGSHVLLFGTPPVRQAQAFDMTSSIAQIETLKALSSGDTL
ncbi:MAG TPA: hypothetical protein VGR15_10025, partial [Bacteroidota bacterium]|nr:hypothetical protein [Bacteroidota bacterium]